MATESVQREVNTALSIDDRDRVDELLSKSMAIVDVMGNTNIQELADNSLTAAGWAARGMLAEVAGILQAGQPVNAQTAWISELEDELVSRFDRLASLFNAIGKELLGSSEEEAANLVSTGLELARQYSDSVDKRVTDGAVSLVLKASR